jgi:prepilin-type N-terminal cleavage/methylation domain-containing protein
MRQTRGFTLLELIVVVLIIGILAAIAIPKFGGTKDRAYVSTMKSDLRNMVTAMESYQSDYAAYPTALNLIQYSPSSGVTITIGGATPSGWDATAKHNATVKTCGIYVGTGTPPISGGQPGEAVCT